MTRHLICLLSRQLVPNYQTVKHFMPDKVWRIATHDALAFDKPFRDTVKRYVSTTMHMPAIDACVVEPYWMMPSLEVVRGLIDAYPDDEWIVNCTGGTKMMAGGALAAAVVAQGAGGAAPNRNVKIVYVDADQEGVFFDAYTGERTPINAEVSVLEYLSLFGVIVNDRPEYTKRPWIEMAIRWCRHGARVLPFVLDETALRNARRNGSSWGSLVRNRAFPEDLWQGLTSLMPSRGEVPNWQIRFCTGDFLELFMLHALKTFQQELGIEHMMRGVRDVHGDVGEVDLYVSRGGELFVIECKSGTQLRYGLPVEVAGQIGTLQGKRQQIGAKKSRALLVTSGLNVLDASGNIDAFTRRLLDRTDTGILVDEQIKRLAWSLDDPAAALPLLRDWMGI